MLDVSTGEVTQLTGSSLAAGVVEQGRPVWSPDSHRFATTSVESDAYLGEHVVEHVYL